MVPLTVSEAAERLCVSSKVVGMWASRGWETEPGVWVKLTPIDRRGKYKAARYSWTELTKAEQETRSKRNRCHRKPLTALAAA